MNNKTRKRIWPVLTAVVMGIITVLAIVALPAGTAQAQTVNPPETPTDDCEVTVNAAGTMVAVTSGVCSAQGDTAEVVFRGSVEATEDVALTLLISDPQGPITAYPNDTIWSGGQLVDTSGESARSMRYRFQSLTIFKAEVNPSTGGIEGHKVTLMIKGDVHVWAGIVSVTDLISGIPSDNVANGSRKIADNSKKVNIIPSSNNSVGQPAIGRDGHDPNYTLDSYEVRSRLDVDTAPIFTGASASVLDGTRADIILSGNSSSVTIRATIRDAENQNLEDVRVTYTAISDPANVETTVREHRSNDAGITDRTISGLPTDKPYRVTVVVTAGEINPLTVGTIVIVRSGDLDSVTATACAVVTGIDLDTKLDGCQPGYNAQSVYGLGEFLLINAKATDSLGTEVTPDTFVLKPATVSTWWDALDCMEMNDAVSPVVDEPVFDGTIYCKMYNELSADAMVVVHRAFSESYGDATLAFDITAYGKNVPYDGVVVLIVGDNVQGAKYIFDIVATVGSGTDFIVRRDQVEVVVLGKLDSYLLDGPDVIYSGDSANYTVTALDKRGNIPTFKVGRNKVRVLVQPNTLLVTNLDAVGNLILNTNTGMGSFEIFAPLDAKDGDTGRIIVGSGTFQQIKSITFEVENTAPMVGSDIDPVNMTVGDDPMMVPTDFTDADGDILTYSVDSSDHSVATAAVNPMGVVAITAVGEGNTIITVTAEDGRGVTATQDIVVTVSLVSDLTAPSNVSVNPQGNGLVQVEWDSAVGAHGYTIVAINIDSLIPLIKIIDDADAVITQITLTPDETYDIYVGSWSAGNKFEIDLSERQRITVY